MKFNMNDKVRVKLTDTGRQIHRKNFDTIMRGTKYEYVPPVEDADGWSEWQLWVLMQEFGAHVYNGCIVPFETNVDLIGPA